jgi:hypothetical protein
VLSVRLPRLASMGTYRGGSKPWEEEDDAGKKLDPRQFPELNAVFYTAQPSEFIKMRIQALTLMAAQDPFLAPAFAVSRQIGSMGFGGGVVPPLDVRQRYVRTEAVTIVHHASEALLRLFVAHIDHPECPWLGMSASTRHGEFKDQIDKALTDGFDRAEIANVFLGGLNPGDAGVEMSEDEFSETIDSLEMLLVDCATRFLGDAFLYNAVKHGLTAIDLEDGEAKMEWVSHEGKRVRMHKGPMHVYLHRRLSPAANAAEGQWFLSLDDPNPQRDLAVTSLVSYAIDALWAVARRQHMGVAGSVWYIARGSVELAIYAPVEAAANLIRRIAHELIKVKTDGEVDGTDHHLSIHHIPEDWTLEDPNHHPAMRLVELPVRPQDAHVPTVSPRAYLPIVPRGFQQG